MGEELTPLDKWFDEYGIVANRKSHTEAVVALVQLIQQDRKERDERREAEIARIIDEQSVVVKMEEGLNFVYDPPLVLIDANRLKQSLRQGKE